MELPHDNPHSHSRVVARGFRCDSVWFCGGPVTSFLQGSLYLPSWVGSHTPHLHHHDTKHSSDLDSGGGILLHTVDGCGNKAQVRLL